jgi:hypothetical protein
MSSSDGRPRDDHHRYSHDQPTEYRVRCTAEYDALCEWGFRSWERARKWNQKAWDGAILTDADYADMCAHARWTGHYFGMALQVVGKQWAHEGGRLDEPWLQRQLVAEKNITIALYLLDDIRGAIYYVQSCVCVLAELGERFGASPWLCALEEELLHLIIALGKRRRGEE